MNLSWKLGLSLGGAADPRKLLPTYDAERRLFANRVIRCSGAYLRFICNLDLPLASLRGLAGDELEEHDEDLPLLDGSTDADRRWMAGFFGRNAMFLIGVDGARVPTVLSPASAPLTPAVDGEISGNGNENRNGNGHVIKNGAEFKGRRPVSILNGVRAPDPRVCFRSDRMGHLYDAMPGVSKFHILIFISDLQGPVRQGLGQLSKAGFGPGGFFERFGGRERFNVVLVAKVLPPLPTSSSRRVDETEEILRGSEMEDLRGEVATVVYDDRQPDEDAHYWYGVNHARGAVVVVRPDLVVGMSAWPEDVDAIDDYLSGFLIEASGKRNGN